MTAADILSFSLLLCPDGGNGAVFHLSPWPPDPCPCQTEGAPSASWLVAFRLGTVGGLRGPSQMPGMLARDAGPSLSLWLALSLGKENGSIFN